jgi:hypothetical protein
LISKEEYVRERVKLATNIFKKNNNELTVNQLIQLSKLIRQWSFDYDIEKTHRPEILKKEGVQKDEK